ncbi:MAG: cytochrome c3 family protein [Desulfobacteraceae bacterium]|nr:cytochrome c3 family protein [Desulfobacteraceae bacterium]MBC2757844.1 cytochrome c3 family protein [Desulfobacteraceae bacterium]
MKNIPVKINFCFMMVCVFLGGMAAFSFIHTCPANTAACAKHEHKQRLPVAFPHDMHMANFDCEACHHKYDDKMNNVIDTMELYSGNPDIMCASCHTSETTLHTRRAYHRQCVGCHNEQIIMNQASAPTMCNECHRPAAMNPTEDEMIIRG